MQASLKNALETLDKSLMKLEKAIDKRLNQPVKGSTDQAELSLDIQHERELNRLLAAKLDSTIGKLESILKEEA